MKNYSKLNKNLNGGYVMLLFVVVGVVITAVIIVQAGIFSGDKGVLENGADAVEDAREVKAKLESNYTFDPDEEERKTYRE